ncbi:MAG: hypothetical protein HPY61_09335 [Methanotrichaceae archaeon]|nr:hypothetical protein [Methanotrichaceae archaeon]
MKKGKILSPSRHDIFHGDNKVTVMRARQRAAYDRTRYEGCSCSNETALMVG